jgi:hypothetical protein
MVISLDQKHVKNPKFHPAHLITNLIPIWYTDRWDFCGLRARCSFELIANQCHSLDLHRGAHRQRRSLYR